MEENHMSWKSKTPIIFVLDYISLTISYFIWVELGLLFFGGGTRYGSSVGFFQGGLNFISNKLRGRTEVLCESCDISQSDDLNQVSPICD